MTVPGASRDAALDRILEEIAGRFAAGFSEEAPALRTVGREAEFPLVNPDGSAADVSTLWPGLLDLGGFRPIYDRAVDGSEFLAGVEADTWSCVIEVGKATVELSVGPRATLHGLARDMERGLDALLEVVRQKDLRLLGYGIQPRTPAGEDLLTGKRRYQALLKAIGPAWLDFCVTAGDQAQIDVGREDVVRQMNLTNAASGAIIALTANSSVYDGSVGRFASGREGLAANMAGEPDRHGSSPYPFADLEQYTRFLAGLRCLCLPDEDGGFEPIGLPFSRYLRQKTSSEDPERAYQEFLFHEHYIWPSARPRSRIGTLEVRPACQQPAGSGWVPSALALGLVEAAEEAQAFFEDALGPDYWPELRRFRGAAVEKGLKAPEPAPGFLETLLGIIRGGLERRGHGEEVFLDPAFRRLERRLEPAARSREAFELGGMDTLVGELSIS